MNRVVTFIVRTLVALILVFPARTQNPVSVSSGRRLGVVTAISAEAKQITIRTDAGPEMVVLLQEDTTFLHVAPGATSLANAATIRLDDVAIGDRFLARGQVSADWNAVIATSVVVMSKADIARKQAADKSEWEKRGVSGVITALKPEAKEITISVPSLGIRRAMTIVLAEGAELRRYAPDSVKFSDASPSRFKDLQVGDQVRALGERSEDGARLTAEELVSGSFLNIAATVNSVSPEEDVIRITDLVGRTQLLVSVNSDSNLRKLPPFVAQMLAMRVGGDGPVSATGTPGAPGRMSGAGMGGPRDLQSMLEKMPQFTLADLKPGDSLIVASTKGTDPSRITAITVLAGVESVFEAASRNGRQMALGSWNLDINMNMGLP